MSVIIQPERVVLTSGEAQRFFADKPQVDWSLSPERGRISHNGEYKAPMLIFNSRIVEVTARSRANPLETGTAGIALSSAPFWISVIAGNWFLWVPALLIALFLVWPPPVQPVSVAVDVDPPTVTLAPKQIQQFFATVPNALDQEVIWSDSSG
jgi:hypothetical protein